MSRSIKICSGIRSSIVCCLRLVRAVGGLTIVFIAWLSWSVNQCFGTLMYSMTRAGSLATPFFVVFFVFRDLFERELGLRAVGRSL